MTLADRIREAVEHAGTDMTLHKPLASHNSTTIYYPFAFGANLRRRLGIGGKSQKNLIGGIGGLYVCLVAVLLIMFGSTGLRELILGVGLFGGWLLCCAATVLGSDDLIYMNRLSCVLPARNPLLTRKLLWSKLEEVSIIDQAQSPPSDFALRLLETSGAEHLITLNLMSKEHLATLVDYIRQYAPHTRGIAQLGEIERFYDYQNGNVARLSYTQLWESACTANFQLTSFTPLAAGSVVQGAFKVLKQIAAGGFSAIYLIEDESGAQFVLKESVLPPGMDETAKAKAIEHFQREARILSKIEHAQVARVYDHFVEAGRSYLRMEYIQGESMRAYIRREGSAAELQTAAWLSQLSKILGYLHGMSPPVVHRDLTPDNILVRPDGSVVLIDFGAANEFVGQATGTLIGKHAYMAPEQIQGCAEPVSDIYSLGAVGYYCVCGRDPEPIRTGAPLRDGAQVSDEFDKFIRSCMDLTRDERIATADVCLEELRKLRSGAATV